MIDNSDAVNFGIPKIKKWVSNYNWENERFKYDRRSPF